LAFLGQANEYRTAVGGVIGAGDESGLLQGIDQCRHIAGGDMEQVGDLPLG
jgi:hypothetical protein